jgi:hypothetical protein
VILVGCAGCGGTISGENVIRNLQAALRQEREQRERTPMPNLDRVNRALHALWTAAVGTPGYDKARWKELASAIDVLATDGPGPLKGGRS